MLHTTYMLYTILIQNTYILPIFCSNKYVYSLINYYPNFNKDQYAIKVFGVTQCTKFLCKLSIKSILFYAVNSFLYVYPNIRIIYAHYEFCSITLLDIPTTYIYNIYNTCINFLKYNL